MKEADFKSIIEKIWAHLKWNLSFNLFSKTFSLFTAISCTSINQIWYLVFAHNVTFKFHVICLICRVFQRWGGLRKRLNRNTVIVYKSCWKQFRRIGKSTKRRACVVCLCVFVVCFVSLWVFCVFVVCFVCLCLCLFVVCFVCLWFVLSLCGCFVSLWFVLSLLCLSSCEARSLITHQTQQ